VKSSAQRQRLLDEGCSIAASARLAGINDSTLTIRIHRMASPVHDRAITLLLDELTTANYCHPETGHRFIYQLV